MIFLFSTFMKHSLICSCKTIAVKSQAEARVTIQEIRNFKVLITNMPHIFFRNKTILFVKIESLNFQHLYDLRLHATSQNFSSFGQLLLILGHAINRI